MVNHTTTGVSGMEITADGDATYVHVSLARVPAVRMTGPSADDMPEDFRQALLRWLGAGADA